MAHITGRASDKKSERMSDSTNREPLCGGTFGGHVLFESRNYHATCGRHINASGDCGSWIKTLRGIPEESMLAAAVEPEVQH